MKTIKYHFIDIQGNGISDIEFDNYAHIDEKFGVIDVNGKKYVFHLETESLFPAPYDNAWYGNFSEGLCKFGMGKKMGIISTEGQEILPAIYDNIYDVGFVDGEAYVKLQNRLLRINKAGEILADLGEGWELEYRSPDGECNCYNRLENDEYWYYIADKNMENRHGPYKEAGKIYEGMRYLKMDRNSNEMYVDENFEKIFEKPAWGSYLSKLVYDGRIMISEKKKYKTGFLNKKGKIAIEPVFADCGFFSEKRVAYKKGRLWGIMDEFGKEITPPTYEMIKGYSDGLACVLSKKKYGYIDREGKIVIPLEYDEACPFNEGIATVGIIRTTKKR